MRSILVKLKAIPLPKALPFSQNSFHYPIYIYILLLIFTSYSFRDVYNSHVTFLVYVMIYIEAFDLVSPSFRFPWMSSSSFFVICLYMQKLLSSPLSAILRLHLYFLSDITSSPLIFIQGITKQCNWLHPTVNVENVQINPIRLTIFSECHSHALVCFFLVMKATSWNEVRGSLL